MERKITAETWRYSEITLYAEKEYENPAKNVILDLEITNGTETLVFPAFWNGKNEYRFRFALPREGMWVYKTLCNVDDENLKNVFGVVDCKEYSGSLEIFRRGFLRAGNKMFVYADGTPFFYLGDTHWNFLSEKFDCAGGHAEGIHCDSHFKHIIRHRVSQGFTVYQTEALETGYVLTDGIDEKDIEYFKKADEYFKFIADSGLVHANAQFFFPKDLIKLMQETDEEEMYSLLDVLSRYWVARYGAFPCLWTLGQEVDNDFYYNECADTNHTLTKENNPYKKIAEMIHKYDPLKQPLSAHQEGSYYIGKFTTAINSAFREIPAHTWWANQWKPVLNAPLDFTAAIDYWYNGQNKPVINYEARYELLWTNSLGARIQGWIAFLNGMFGHGYGVVDMWLYKSTYDIKNPTRRDGIEISVEEKLTPWGKSIDLPGGKAMEYMKKFFLTFDWFRLIPCFDENKYFVADGGYYSAAHIDRDIFVAYFYGKIDGEFTKETGTFINLDENARYTYTWFDPETSVFLKTLPANVKGGCFALGERPSAKDWVVLIKKES